MIRRSKPIIAPEGNKLGWKEFIRLEARLGRTIPRHQTIGVTLDLQSIERVYVDGIIPLIASVCRFRLKFETPITVVAPSDPKTRDYFVRQDWLFHLSPQQYPRLAGSAPSALRRFSNAEQLNEAINHLQRMSAERLRFAEGAHTALDWAMNEIADNVLNHSGAEGFLQVMPDRPHDRLNIVVCDTGFGIPETLRPSFQVIRSDEDALKMAITKGITRSSEVGQGNGLFGAVAIAQASGCTLDINSGSAHLSVRSGAVSTSRGSGTFHGTAVYLQFNCQVPIDLPRTLGHVPLNPVLDSTVDGSDFPEIVLSEYADNFGNRATGRRIRTLIENALVVHQNSKVRIRMSGIPIVSSSFADEAIAKLVVDMGIVAFSQRVEIIEVDPLTKGIVETAINQRLADTRERNNSTRVNPTRN